MKKTAKMNWGFFYKNSVRGNTDIIKALITAVISCFFLITIIVYTFFVFIV